jgi:hypothetical protein
MRWILPCGLALSFVACEQTVIVHQSARDGAVAVDGGPALCSGPLSDFFPELPEVIVALDRSTGMGAAVDVAREALDLNATRYQKVVRFGYVEFPGAGTICTQCGSCASTISRPSANLEGFSFALHACDATNPACPDSSQRGTIAALSSCQLVFGSPDRMRRFVLLISNGRPDCGSNQNSGCMSAQGPIGQLLSVNVNTIVVAPGQLDADTSQCLQDLATAGGARSNFHPTQDATDLSFALGDITRAIALNACELELETPIVDPDRTALFWKNMPIPRLHNGNDGWELMRNGFEIILHGQWCDHLVDDGPANFQLFPDCNPRP